MEMMILLSRDAQYQVGFNDNENYLVLKYYILINKANVNKWMLVKINIESNLCNCYQYFNPMDHPLGDSHRNLNPILYYSSPAVDM